MDTATIDPVVRTPTETHPRVGAHGVLEIYQRCDCDPDDPDFHATHFVIDDVGVTCARGLLYVVCTECCCSANQRRCEETHVHGHGHPWCPDAGTDGQRH